MPRVMKSSNIPKLRPSDEQDVSTFAHNLESAWMERNPGKRVTEAQRQRWVREARERFAERDVDLERHGFLPDGSESD